MRFPRFPRVRFELVSALLILLVGCATPPSSTNLNFLVVKASPATVSVGGAVTLQAIAHLSDGSTQDVTSSTQWTLSNPSLATLGSGVLASKAPGSLSVQAAYVMVVAAGQSSSTAGSTPQTLSSSAQVTITPAGTTTTAPVITWSTPAPIQYGMALSSAELDAKANVPGSFTYTPAAATVLKAGNQTLTAIFTPTDTTAYSAATATVKLTVNPANPVITWAPPSPIQQGTAITAAQLDATANVPGTFSYSPSVGTVPPVGIQTLTATFTPYDKTDYMPATAHNTLIVDAPGTSTPTISWNTPASISYGTALSSAQLNATASVAGTFAYTPAAGTVLKVGTQTLSAIFAPTNTSAYSPARATVQLTVTKASPVITWPQPSAVQRGAALSATQLNATANVPGAFSYSPAAGTVPPVGIQALTATFTPSDATDYMSATAHNTLIVDAPGMSTPTIRWSTPAAISYGTALSSAQLNATASVPGTFTYTPAAGTVLKAGTQTLSAVFTPANTTTYSAATATVQLTVNQVAPVITWAPLAAITQGTALGSAQLDATANVPGAFSYNPGAGSVPAAGTLQLTAAFTPTDATDYSAATAHNTLVVNSSTQAPAPPTNPAPAGCGGPTINLNSGMSQSTLQSTIASAPSCALVIFAAGTYNITGTLNIPCSSRLTLTGPAATPATAIMNPSFTNQPIFNLSDCTGVSIEYINFTKTQSIKFNFDPGSWCASGCLISHNQFTGLTAQLPNGNGGNSGPACDSGGGTQGNCDSPGDTALTFSSYNGTACPGCSYLTNTAITYNQFGDASSCLTPADVMDGTTYDYGGNCSGIQFYVAINGVTVEYNNFVHLEEGFHVLCGPVGGDDCSGPTAWTFDNFTADYNDFSGIHRFGAEMQLQGSSNVHFDHNSFHTPTAPWAWTFGVSNACCAGLDGSAMTAPGMTNIDDVIIAEAPSTGVASGSNYIGMADESWGNGAQYINSVVQGYWANGFEWAYITNGSISNNIICGPSMAANKTLINQETTPPTSTPPTISGNTTGSTCSTVPSTAPTISPAGGAVSSATTVTLTDSGMNQSIYYTTDGSTPTTGSTLYTGPFQVSAGSKVQAIAMWGAPNQPKGYAAGYGYVPSAVVSASFSAAAVAANHTAAKISSAVTGANTIAPIEAAGNGGATTAELTSVAVVPAQAMVTIGSTTQLKAIATFSDGSTKDVTANFAWASSDSRTITATSSGLLAGLATGKATITGSYQGRQASVPVVSSIGPVDWSSPIVITEAGTYSGNWRSTDSKTPAVTVATTAPVVIENSHISSVAGLIKTSVAGADVTVRNSVGLALNPAVKGQSNGVFLDASSPARLDVENNYVEDAGGGVLVHGYSGNRDGQQTIVIRANRARNLNGLLSDGKGGYLPGVGSHRAVSRFIELDKVQSVPGIDLGWNEVINYPGRSLVADNIDVKRSSGTPNQPLEIHDTYIQGAYPYTAAQADYQGGGIKTEGSPDDSAQDATAFNNIHDNQVVGTVNYGIAFTAGHDNIASNNRVISSGQLADGTRIAAQHVGLANGDGNGAGGNIYNNTMHDNLIGWACWNSSCSQSGYRKDESFPASPADYSTNSVLPAQPITPEMENNEYEIWLNKTASAGIAVGPAF
jgi:Chitobiase/beta-hexosaminidase C-terminal domain/Bacterial Ig-like domain (group 2)